MLKLPELLELARVHNAHFQQFRTGWQDYNIANQQVCFSNTDLMAFYNAAYNEGVKASAATCERMLPLEQGEANGAGGLHLLWAEWVRCFTRVKSIAAAIRSLEITE